MTLSASEVEAVMVGLTKRMLILVDDQSMGMAIETEMYGDVTERDPVQVQDVLKMRESLERTGLTQSSLDLNKITLSALSYADGVDAFDVGSASTGVVKLLSLPLSAFDANNAGTCTRIAHMMYSAKQNVIPMNDVVLLSTHHHVGECPDILCPWS